jgi:tRNA pseudouridine38-40 synthase
MHNVKLTIAYDGTDFRGWQIQPGQPTIQQTITDVLAKLTQERVTIHASGRTDSGVHALGQVAHFKTHSELSPLEFQRALNALLPSAIRIVGAEEVGPDFHSRWNAQAKTYIYRIHRGRVVLPFVCRYALHDPFPLDFETMSEAARLFEGEHDFTSFAASTGSEDDDHERNVTRVIFRSEVLRGEEAEERFPALDALGIARPGPEEWVYVVRGRSFMRFMVRKIAGTLVDVGRGRLRPDDIPKLFEMKDRSRSGPTLPPHGLCLLSVEYPDPADSLAARG